MIRALVLFSTVVLALLTLQLEVGPAQAGAGPRGVSLLPFAPFAQNKTLPDLTIAHLEITQVIQRWGDVSPLVPLVRGKPTLVRVYVAATGGPGPGPGGTWSVTWT